MLPRILFSLLAGQIGILGMVVGMQTAAAQSLTILHTNDIHGHVNAWQGWDGELAGKTLGGMDRLATAIKRARSEAGANNVLLLDAGDTLGDSMLADETKGKAIIDAMNAMKYDAMVIGNHEPDFTAEKLKQRIADAKFPVIAANITEQASGKLFAQPFVIKQVAGIKVGILGLAYPNTPLTTAKKNVVGLTYAKAPEVARDYIPKLRAQGAQLIIVLSHYGLSADKKLAQEVPGIDIIVGGHSHNRMAEAAKVGDTLIVQAGAHASDLGRLDLQLDHGKITSSTHKLITLDNASIASDKTVAAIVEKDMAPYKTQMQAPVARARATIARAQTIAGQEPAKRDQESPADSLFADLIRARTGADIVILPGVGYGTALVPGAFDAAALRNLIPHESKVISMTLTGQQIKEILEQSLENTYTDDPNKKVGGLVQISGMVLQYHKEGSYPTRVAGVTVNGRPLVAGQNYKVTTNSLLADGGHNYKTFLQGKDKKEGESQFDLVKQALSEKGEVQPPALGRIVNLDNAK